MAGELEASFHLNLNLNLMYSFKFADSLEY
jgi:hypothetical protein